MSLSTTRDITSAAGTGWGTLSRLRLATRFARREMRAGVRGFSIFVACLALGVASIAGVNALSGALNASIATEGQKILGGDLRFSLIHREVDNKERAFLESLGPVSGSATMRAIVRLPDGSDQALTELKGVDDIYPLYGEVRLGQEGGLQSLLARQPDGSFGAVAEAGLLARLNLALGDQVSLGSIAIRIMDTIEREPDRLSGGIDLAPRLLLSLETMRASGLVKPGSLVRWHYQLKLGADATKEEVDAAKKAANDAFPKAGWQIRGRENASPGLSRNIERSAHFLTLVGLTALIVGGVGVANAVSAYLDRKREVIATLKSIGASGSFVFNVYIIQILMIASLAIALGLVVGSAVPPLAGLYLKRVLPIDIDTGLQPTALALAAVYGYLMTLVFALWPLARARDIRPTALFRNHDTSSRKWPHWPYLLALAACILLLVALSVGLADNRRIAAYFVGGSVISFAILRGVAFVIMAVARRLPHARSPALRLAIGNIHRPGSITPSVILSLGLGLTLLVTIALIDGNLRNQLTASLAEKAPSFFFVDIQNDELAPFKQLIREQAPEGKLQAVPSLRGFFVEIGGRKPDTIKVDSEHQWALRGDRGITYSSDIPENSTLSEGEWWAVDYSGPSLVSFDEEIARAFGLKLGDTVTVNVLGREITSTLASTRKVVWQSLGINFLMVFSPNTFTGAPHANLATLGFPDGATADAEFALMKVIASTFPTVTTIRIKDALDRVAQVVGQLAWAVRAASAVTLISSILVLAGALTAGQRTQIHDAVILKTIGATRGQLLKTYLLQFSLLGALTAIFGILAGTLASWFVVVNVMEDEFVFIPSAALSATILALFMCIGIGLAGTWRILGQKAAPLLRNA